MNTDEGLEALVRHGMARGRMEAEREFRETLDSAKKEYYNEGYFAGFAEGHVEGYGEGYDDGYVKGFETGFGEEL